MFFRNVQFFLYPPSVGALDEAAMRKHALRDCGALEMQSRGFVSPYGRKHAVLIQSVGTRGPELFVLGSWDKILPTAVVNEEVARRVAELSEERGKPVGGRERKRIRDEALTALLPRALVRPGRIAAYVAPKLRAVLVDAASRKAAESVMTVVREAHGTFIAVPPDPAQSPRSILTGWVAGAKLPDGFELGDTVDLVDPADAHAKANLRRLDLASSEVLEHMKAGKQVASLGLVFQQRVSFVLRDDLSLRSIKFLDVVLEELESTDSADPLAELDTRFVLMAGALQPLIEQLIEIFRINRPRDRS